MTQYARPIDSAGAMASALSIAAAPVPADLAGMIPYSCVTCTGGGRRDLIVDNFYLDVDTWDEDYAQAFAVAAEVMGDALELPGTTAGGAVWCAVTVETMPYENPDPDEPELARVTFSLRATVRANVIDPDIN